MKIEWDDNREGKVVRIDVGTQLDLTAYKRFAEATIRAEENSEVVAIVVDLGGTSLLLDSGLAMLLDLKKRAISLGIPLHLVNTRPEIRHKLSIVDFSTVHLNRYANVGVYKHHLRNRT